ncbi:MAG: metallophosphoesterase family protein, partial [Proteobacteria bacterium]|nr:metallophosphoesterase family protein [Pseudomonadota bacterium]
MILLMALAAYGAPLERDAYVMRVGTDEATILWKTAAASTGAARVTSDGWLTYTEVASTPDAELHEVRFTGLNADQEYDYAVVSDGVIEAEGPEYHFRTNPPVGSRDPVRMWVVGDSGTGGSAQARVRDAMLESTGRDGPDLFLHVGDMAYSSGYELEFTDKFFAPYARILRNVPIWPAMGNHEGRDADSATETGGYYDAYALPKDGEIGGEPSGAEAYYSFDYGNVHVIVLDSYETDRDPVLGAMAQWLHADLLAASLRPTPPEWIIASFHHPPYTDGSHDSEVETRHIDMRMDFLPILEAGGVDLVLGGHSHIYERSYLLHDETQRYSDTSGVLDFGDGHPGGDGPYVKQIDGLGNPIGSIYVVAGHGGTGVSGNGQHPVMAYSEVDHGSVIVDTHANRLDLHNINDLGVITDRATLIKGPGIVVVAPNGGESLAPLQSVDITWASTPGVSAEVDLAYSCDNGQTWTPIADAVPNNGTYSWQVPEIVSADVRVRVADTGDGALSDESNARFEVSALSRTTVVPYQAVWWYSDDNT